MWYHLHLIPLQEGTEVPTASWPAREEGHFPVLVSPHHDGELLNASAPSIFFKLGTLYIRQDGQVRSIRVNGSELACARDRPLLQSDIIELNRAEEGSYRSETSCRVDLSCSSSSSINYPGPYSLLSSDPKTCPAYAWTNDFTRALDDQSRHHGYKSPCPPLKPAAFTFGVCTVTTTTLFPRTSRDPSPVTYHHIPISVSRSPQTVRSTDAMTSVVSLPIPSSGASDPSPTTHASAPSPSISTSGSITTSSCTAATSPCRTPYGDIVGALRSRGSCVSSERELSSRVTDDSDDPSIDSELPSARWISSSAVAQRPPHSSPPPSTSGSVARSSCPPVPPYTSVSTSVSISAVSTSLPLSTESISTSDFVVAPEDTRALSVASAETALMRVRQAWLRLRQDSISVSTAEQEPGFRPPATRGDSQDTFDVTLRQVGEALWSCTLLRLRASVLGSAFPTPVSTSPPVNNATAHPVYSVAHPPPAMIASASASSAIEHEATTSSSLPSASQPRTSTVSTAWRL
ncbi:hypothetical protein CF326_g8813 [Tilletia indica]|nr:hypothetical protein CF326_g8813 [Tilletia indica]